MQNETEVHALTKSYPSISRFISTPVHIYNTETGANEKTLGIWDTGATGSAITKTFAMKLGLVPVGQTRVKGVHGYKDGINVYGVKIVLSNQNISFILPVTECNDLTDDHSAMLLIGMDIISEGDFAISGFQNKTVMTFRVPSIERFDFTIVK